MALDFPVTLELHSRRQKLEHTLILALDVYLSHVGETPYAHAHRVQKEIEADLGKSFPDTPEGREAALKASMGNLSKFMREVALYMGVVGAVRFLVADALFTEPPVEHGQWTPLVSDELRALNYCLSYRTTPRLVEYKLYYENNGIDVDNGVVPNPLFDR